MKKTGFYIIKDKFFEDMADPFLKNNKGEGRPHYYCFEDTNTGIYWMIPLSSRIEKYSKIMQQKEQSGRPCDIIHIAKLDNNKKAAFLIQDMFPVTDRYIERNYTISGKPMLLTSEHTIKIIDRKARKVRELLKKGVKFTPTQPNAMLILTKLK